MKRILTIIILALTTTVFAQAPQKMSYQAVIRNSQNQLLTSAQVGMQISVLQGSADGKAVYVETQNKSTNTNGLVSLEIGMGKAITGSFSEINWAEGPYFIKTETDPNGGNAYSIIGSTELMSVPYALFAANVATNSGAKKGKDKDDEECCCFKHYLGEEYMGGIIFNIYKGSDGNEHGLIVAKTESLVIWNLTDTILGADRTWDGAYNTAKMGAGGNSPAYNYVTSLGQGWYIPAIDELVLLYQSRFYVNKALKAGNYALVSGKNTPFANGTAFPYASSTEEDLYAQQNSFGFIWVFDMVGFNGPTQIAGPMTYNSQGNTKVVNYLTRAVRAF